MIIRYHCAVAVIFSLILPLIYDGTLPLDFKDNHVIWASYKLG